MPRRPAPLPALIAIVAAIVVALAAPLAVTAADDTSLSDAQRDTLLRYATDTWAGFVAMTDPDTGLPADSLAADGTPSVQTSTTNIGAYMWSTVVAEALGHHRPRRGGRAPDGDDLLARDDGTPRAERPVLQLVRPHERREADRLATDRRTADQPDPVVGRQRLAGDGPAGRDEHRPGGLRSGGRAVRQHGLRLLLPARRQPDRASTSRRTRATSPCCYDTIVSESRIASYIGIAKGELPPKEYFGAWRTFPDTCDWSWPETKPVGFNATYLGVNVFEGAYPYEDFRVVPGWGGSMFEALMPALFVPEEEWAPRSWAINHPLTITAQIHHGLVEAEYGYWGFSPANVPEGGYTEYGVDAIGMNPEGYKSNNDSDLRRSRVRGLPGTGAAARPAPSAYTNGVVTPHAAFLALRWAPDAVMENLANLEADFDIYDQWGFRDSRQRRHRRRSPDAYLSLDQGIVMAAIGNALADDLLRDAFATKQVRNVLKPVIGMERFNAGPRSAVDYDPAP